MQITKKNPTKNKNQQNNQPRNLKIAYQQLCMGKGTGGKSVQTSQSCPVCGICAHNVMDSEQRLQSPPNLLGKLLSWTQMQSHTAMGALPAGFYFAYLQKLTCICCELHSEPVI